jgi:hypothetical protein
MEYKGSPAPKKFISERVVFSDFLEKGAAVHPERYTETLKIKK